MRKTPGYLAIALTIAAVLAGGTAASAQTTDAPAGAAQGFGPRKGAPTPGDGGKTETVGTFGKWTVQCTEAPPGEPGIAPGSKVCAMIQPTASEKNDKIQLSVIVSRVKHDNDVQTLVRVLTPIGVYLPTGIPVEIDGAALPNRLVFTRCSPRMCEAFGDASPESLKKFAKGTDSTFYIYDRPGNGYPMKISLEGFSAALSELDKH